MLVTRKAGRLAAGLAALSLTVAACGGGSSDSGAVSDSAGAVDGQGKTLSVWIMEGTNPDAKPFFAGVSAAFKKETGATLDVQYVPWAEAHDKFVNSIAGGTTPDVAEVGTTWTPEFADAGALADLSARGASRPASTATSSPAWSTPAPWTASSTACRGTPASAR